MEKRLYGTEVRRDQRTRFPCSPGSLDFFQRLFAMILEAVQLRVLPGKGPEYEAAFLKAQDIIISMPGYLSHELQRCLERPDEYLLLVRWESVQAHEVGFRQSPRYQEWKRLLHRFYDPFPEVLHFEAVPRARG